MHSPLTHYLLSYSFPTCMNILHIKLELHLLIQLITY